MKKLLAKIRELLRDRRNRRLFTRVVSVNAAIVVFVTTYALVLPAITMESEAACGIPAHQHDDSCYEEVLTCDLPESDGHTHDESCYTVTEELVCGLEEHVHSPENGCYDEEGNLICELQEHAHTDDCYKEEKTLTCGLEESEGHHHDASCYDKVLTCGLEVHVHSAECYQEDIESSAVAASTGAASVEIGNDGTGADDEAQTVDTDASVTTDENTASSDAAMTENVNTAANAADPDITEESSAAATTGVLPEPIAEEELSEGYVPTLDMLNMDAVLTNKTGVYYYHAEDNEQIPANSEEIDSWKKFKENDSEALAPADLVRAYFAYTIPAGSLNETNQIARYRLPSNLHLTDDQIIAINQNENGIASQFINYDTLEITDTDKYDLYRGAEAVEGTRTPDQTLADDAQEYISAVVKAENVYDEEGLYGEKGAYLGQDLIFIFTPYTIEKNQNTYDSEGNPTSAGQKVTGWFACDFNMDQIDWVEEETSFSEVTAEPETDAETETEAAAEPETEIENAAETGADLANTPGSTYTSIEKSAEIIFAAQDDVLNIKEISQALKLVEIIETPVDAAKDAADEVADEAVDEASAEEATPEENIADDASSDETTEEAAAEETASAAAEDDLTADNEQPETAATDAATDADAKEKTEEPEYKSGTLKATGADYTITLDYTPDACIPENAELQIREITKETDPEAYEACLKQAKEQVVDPDADGHTDVDQEASRFFDIEIIERITEKTDVAEVAEEIVADTSAIENAGPDYTEDAENATENADSKHTAEAENTTDADNDTATDTDTENTEATEIETENTEAAEVGTENIGDSIRKIEPKAPVTVNIQLSNKADTKTDTTNADKSTSDQETASGPSDPTVLHFASEGTEQIESTVGNAEKSETEDKTVDIQFEAESFSIYGVVYTVDFHWEINGKTYEFSLPGGGYVSLETLLEVLGVANRDDEQKDDTEGKKDDNDAAHNSASLNLEDVQISEETQKLFNDIQKIEFSNPDLVWVGKVDEESTVGEIKEKNGLEVEYSEELSEEKIAEINAQTAKAGDWALIGMRPFLTEEVLTIALKTDEVFTIKVTDAQITKKVLTADGETYVITITYTDAAEIPDDADLKVKEILPETADYQKYLTESAEKLAVDNQDVTHARFFDIEIVKDGEKIEPKVPVEVSIRQEDAIDVSLGDNLCIVHFADKGTEVINDVKLSDDQTETTYKQESFSVVGQVVTTSPAQGSEDNLRQYALVVKYDGAFYSIDSDGTLTPVDVDDENNPTKVTLGSPMLWSYDQNGTIYHHSDATDTDAGAIAADFYYKYLDINQEYGIFEEKKINVDQDPASSHYENYTSASTENTDVKLIVKKTTHVTMGDKLAWKVLTHKKATACRVLYNAAAHTLTSGNGEYVLDIGRDENQVLRIIRKASNESSGVPVYFTDVSSSVPEVNPYKHTVSHIDISIKGSADIQVPLAYGIYYDGSGNDRKPVLKIEDGIYYEWKNEQWVVIEGMDDDHPITVHKEFTEDNEITGEDIKSATITATDINGKPLPADFGAYYITGYSMNAPDNNEPEQVRIEGSFKVATLPEIRPEDHGNTPNDADTCAARLATAIKYKVTLVKHNQELNVAWNGTTLYNSHGDEMKLTTDITLSSVPFTYWDDGNKCPPLWAMDMVWNFQTNSWDFIPTDRKATWQDANGRTVKWEDGAIYTGAGAGQFAVEGGANNKEYWLSGIDYRLAGDQVIARAEIPGLEVTKYILDDTGKQIELDPETYDADPLRTTIHVYEKQSPNYESDDVLRLNGGDATRATGNLPVEGQYRDPTLDPEHADLYEGYQPITQYDFHVEVGNNGKGLEHNYRVTDGMYYIEEEKSTVAPKVVGADGTTYRYTQTHIESEYAWRDDEFTATRWGGSYNEPVHVSPTYSDLSNEGPAYRSIPEVLGNYKDKDGSWVQEDGSSIRNTMLPFYVYNVYTPDVKLEVEKQWVGYEPTADTEVKAELYYAKRKVKNADGTTPDPLADWPDKADYEKVAGAKWDGSDGTKKIFEDTVTTELTLKADSDATKNWKGTFNNLPHRLTDEAGNVWEFDYFAKETAVKVGNENLLEEFEYVEKKTEPTEEEAHLSDGKVTIVNARGSLQLIKKWLRPDGKTEYTPSDTNAEITAQLRRKRTVNTTITIPGEDVIVQEEPVSVTVMAKGNNNNYQYNQMFKVADLKPGKSITFSIGCSATSYFNENDAIIEPATSNAVLTKVAGRDVTYQGGYTGSKLANNSNVYTLSDVRENTIVYVTLPSANTNTLGYWYDSNYEKPGTTTVPGEATTDTKTENLDEPVTIEGKITDGEIKLNKTNGWTFKLSGAEMEPGWEYYIVESSIKETNVPADQFTYVAPVKTVDEDGNVVYTAKNISKGLTLDVDKSWESDGGKEAPANAEVTVKLQYRTRLETNTSGAWSEWALVEDHQGAGQPFDEGIITTLTLKADADDSRNWKGCFERLPDKVVIEDETYDVEYMAVETAVTIDGKDVTKQYTATVNKVDASNSAISAGTINIRNDKERVRVTVQKSWDPVPSNSDASVTVELHRYAKKTKGTFSVTLTDQNDAAVPGAEFTLYKDSEATETVLTTDVNGKVNATNLEPGTYHWVQTKIPDGYTLPDGATVPYKSGDFTVNADSTAKQEKTFELKNKREKTAGQVTLTVLDNKQAPVEGATFTLYKGETAVEGKNGLETNEQGKIIIDDLEPGTYHFVQTATPDAYYLPENLNSENFTVQENMPGQDQIFTVSMTNKLKGKGSVEITLSRQADNAAISGAVFELWKNGSKVADGMTGADGKLTFGSTTKLDAGTYTVKQITSDPDCIPAGDQTFTIQDNGETDQTTQLAFKNQYQSLGTATIRLKRADNNAVIVGAGFELYRGSELIETGTTDAGGQLTFGTAEKLPAGSYTVRQTSTADGLDIAADQTFAIEDNGNPNQSKTLEFLNNEASGNVTINIYTKGGLGQWNWFLINSYPDLNINKEYTFKADLQAGMYPDRIKYCVIEGTIQDSTSTSNEENLKASGFANGGTSGTYTFKFTPTKKDTIYNLVLIANNWGVEGIKNYQMVQTNRAFSVQSVPKMASRLGASKNTALAAKGGLEAGGSKLKSTPVTVTDAQPVKVPADKAADYMEDSTFTVKSYTITSSDDNWSHTFDAEDKYDADGNEYYYYVVETDHNPANYWIEKYEGGPLNSDGTITVSNVQRPGGLTITKRVTVNNGAVPSDNNTIADGTYTFTITGPNSYSRTETITVTNGVAANTIVLENLTPGNYTIAETGSTNTNGITLDGAQTIPVAAGSQASANVAAFTNNLQTADLNIKKVDALGMTTPLPGAKFEVRRIDGNTTSINYLGGASDAETTGEDHKTGEDGVAVFKNLINGYYEIWERELPAGYVLTDSEGKFYIKVDGGTISVIKKTDSAAPKNWPGRPDDATFTFAVSTKTATVGNTPGAELPASGGPGTRLIYLIGGVLALSAALTLWKRRDKTII